MQRRLYLLILAQLPTPAEAEEVLQDVNVILWRKADEFEAGTNFFAWAAQVARFEVLKCRRRYARSKLRFSDEFIATVAEDVEERSDLLEARRHALKHCLDKLKPNDRDLIDARYRDEGDAKDLAARLGRPANSVYQSIGRIRKTLLDCIERRVAAAG